MSDGKFNYGNKIYENIIFVFRKICVQKGKDQKIILGINSENQYFFFVSYDVLKIDLTYVGLSNKKERKRKWTIL